MMTFRQASVPCIGAAVMNRIALAATVAGLSLLSTGRAAEKDSDAKKIFNGESLRGWVWVSRDGKSKAEDVWSVKDGILICKGKPTGYIRTFYAHKNYRLSLQWRWKSGTKRGNSGVLLHCEKSSKVWPKSIESQLMTGNAGDFFTIGGTTIEIPNADKRKRRRRHINLTDDSEKKIGEWNTMVVTCKGNTITVHVNGDLVNQASKASVTKGHIGLQSEGTEIHFRNISLTRLK